MCMWTSHQSPASPGKHTPKSPVGGSISQATFMVPFWWGRRNREDLVSVVMHPLTGLYSYYHSKHEFCTACFSCHFLSLSFALHSLARPPDWDCFFAVCLHFPWKPSGLQIPLYEAVAPVPSLRLMITLHTYTCHLNTCNLHLSYTNP